MARWLFALLLLAIPAVAAADVPDRPPAYDPPATRELSDYERGHALGQAIAPLCCLCMFVGGALGAGGLAFFVLRKKKD